MWLATPSPSMAAWRMPAWRCNFEPTRRRRRVWPAFRQLPGRPKSTPTASLVLSAGLAARQAPARRTTAAGETIMSPPSLLVRCRQAASFPVIICPPPNRLLKAARLLPTVTAAGLSNSYGASSFIRFEATAAMPEAGGSMNYRLASTGRLADPTNSEIYFFLMGATNPPGTFEGDIAATADSGKHRMWRRDKLRGLRKRNARRSRSCRCQFGLFGRNFVVQWRDFLYKVGDLDAHPDRQQTAVPLIRLFYRRLRPRAYRRTAGGSLDSFSSGAAASAAA